MGIFIRVTIDPSSCVGMETCGECVNVCPVGIFEGKSHTPRIDEAYEDECTLCQLCINACQPRAITIHKLYDE